MNPKDEARVLLSRLLAAAETLRGGPVTFLSVQPRFEVLEALADLLGVRLTPCPPSPGIGQVWTLDVRTDSGVNVSACQSRPGSAVEPLPFATEAAP